MMRRLALAALSLFLTGGVVRGPGVGVGVGVGLRGGSSGAGAASFEVDYGANAGVDALDPALTINGTTVTPDFRYTGGDADLTNWDADGYGETLTYTKVSTDLSINQGSPGLGSTDDSVGIPGNVGGSYYTGSSSAIGDVDVSAEDWVLEALLRPSRTGTRTVASKLHVTGAINGWEFQDQLGVLRWTIFSSGTAANLEATTNAPAGAWIHIIIFGNEDGSAAMYLNGSLEDTVVVSTLGATASSDALTMFARAENKSLAGACGLAYISLWTSPAGWLDTHLQATVAADRFHAYAGTKARIARGDPVPTAWSRASTAMLRKRSAANVTKLYEVGAGWPRVEDIDDSTGTQLVGYLAEEARTNTLLQSEDVATTWTEVDATDTQSLNAIAAPDGATTMDGNIGSTTDGEHGFTQAITMTAATWTCSTFAQQGDQTHLYLSDNTVATATGYFDLTDCTADTIGAAATGGCEDYGNNKCRCFITFTGTAAAHTVAVQSAAADGDNTFAGDGATINTYFWGMQCEAGEHPSSYIPTTTGSVARAADVLRYEGLANVGGVGSNQAGAVTAQFLIANFDAASSQFIWSLSDGGVSADRIQQFIGGAGDRAWFYGQSTEDGAHVSIADTTTDVVDGTAHTFHSTWRADDFRVYVDGASEGTPDTVAPNPADDLDQLHIGSDHNNGQIANGNISKVTIYPATRNP